MSWQCTLTRACMLQMALLLRTWQCTLTRAGLLQMALLLRTMHVMLACSQWRKRSNAALLPFPVSSVLTAKPISPVRAI